VHIAQIATNRHTPLEDWWTGGTAAMLVVQVRDDIAAPPGNGHALRATVGDRAQVIDIAKQGISYRWSSLSRSSRQRSNSSRQFSDNRQHPRQERSSGSSEDRIVGVGDCHALQCHYPKPNLTGLPSETDALAGLPTEPARAANCYGT
jgi:hypothetical protein